MIDQIYYDFPNFSLKIVSRFQDDIDQFRLIIRVPKKVSIESKKSESIRHFSVNEQW